MNSLVHEMEPEGLICGTRIRGVIDHHLLSSCRVPIGGVENFFVDVCSGCAVVPKIVPKCTLLLGTGRRDEVSPNTIRTCTTWGSHHNHDSRRSSDRRCNPPLQPGSQRASRNLGELVSDRWSDLTFWCVCMLVCKRGCSMQGGKHTA